MTDPLPLEDVLGIVERRRRRRARVQGVMAPALSVAAVGVAGIVVVAVQAGPEPAAPAAPGLSALPPTPPSATAPASSVPAPPPIDPGFLRPDYLPSLAQSLFLSSPSQEELDRALTDADDLARAWGLEVNPAAMAVVAKADLTGVPIDPRSTRGDDVLADRFAEAGYTTADAAGLAEAWQTDARTAEVMGGLLVEAGFAG